MSDEYEWDRSGEAPNDLADLESLMSTLRYEEPVVATVAKPAATKWYALAAAAVLLLGIGISLWASRSGEGPALATKPCNQAVSEDGAWSVKVVSGKPRCGDAALAATATLPVGAALETDRESRAEIQVANIGHIVLAPSSRLSLRSSGADEHRMQLDYGSLHARIDAPPRLFLVQTPSALAVDLGCEYSLEVGPEGKTHLHVSDGYVSLESGAQAIYVPAGYMSDSYPDKGPSLPYGAGASPELLQSIRDLLQKPKSKGAVAAVLAASTRPEDTLGVWHLLAGSYCEDANLRLREVSKLDPDPLKLGWGSCSDPERKAAWQNVLDPLWEL